MKKFAVIGKDVSKSLSPVIHSFIARQTGETLEYDRVSISENNFNLEIEKLFERYDGFNVTIPYKLSIIPFLKNTEGDAKVFGAVNTVRVGDMSGHNTDGQGFMLMLENNGISVQNSTCLLLGAGGAGRSVAKKLVDGGAKVEVYDVKSQSAINLAEEFKGVKAIERVIPKDYYAIINASGVGMHDAEGISPVSVDVIEKCSVAIDLIYEPKESEFLRLAKTRGKTAINGRAMLFYQAYLAQCIFFQKQANKAQAKELFNKFEEEVL